MLIAWGVVSEETYVAALAASLGMPIEPLGHAARWQCPLPDHQLVDAANTGMMPLMSRDEMSFVVAPRLIDSRRLTALAVSGGEPAQRLRLTTAARLRGFVDRHTARDIQYRAVSELHAEHPEFSAVGGRRAVAMLAVFAAAAAFASVLAPSATLMAVEVAFGLVFLSWTGLRLIGLLSERFVRRRPRILTDDRLPIYTIVVAIYREAVAVPGLIAALRNFNYPLEKLDIKLVLEPDDHEARRAVKRLQLGFPFEVIFSPARRPRTKPKALNAALPFARGSFLAVYDAEDRPEPDQLRLALDAFVAEDARLACVQARLTIDNTADSWLTRLFTAEYAGLFDGFLPGLARWRLPLPLGGSSNHFRTAVLRRIGAWDPYNVTRRCRPRHAARPLRLSHRRHPLDHIRGGAGAIYAVASPAHAMVQGLDAPCQSNIIDLYLQRLRPGNRVATIGIATPLQQKAGVSWPCPLWLRKRTNRSLFGMSDKCQQQTSIAIR